MGFIRKIKDLISRQTGNKEKQPEGIILAEGMSMPLDAGQYNSVLVFGDAGTGKTFRVIEPNILQMSGSYVISDPSGSLFAANAKLLLENGYNVKLFSLCDMEHSHCYNPFAYCYNAEGKADRQRTVRMVHTLLQDTKIIENRNSNKFYRQASESLFTACALFLLEFRPPEAQSLYHLAELLHTVAVRRKDGTTKLDEIFEAARQKDPAAECLASYDTFKLAPKQTEQEVISDAVQYMRIFEREDIRSITSTDYRVRVRNMQGKIREYFEDENGDLIRTENNIDLNTVGDEKTAIFIATSHTDTTYLCLEAMLYSQLFDILSERAKKLCPDKYMIVDRKGNVLVSMIDTEEKAKELQEQYKNAQICLAKRFGSYGDDVVLIQNSGAPDPEGALKIVYSKECGEAFLKKFEESRIVPGSSRLPVHVQCLMDNFKDIRKIAEFPEVFARTQELGISCIIVIQKISDFQLNYDKVFPDFISGSGAVIIFHSDEPETVEHGAQIIRCGHYRYYRKNPKKRRSQQDDLLFRDPTAAIRKMAPGDTIVYQIGELCRPGIQYRTEKHPMWTKTGWKDVNSVTNAADFAYCARKSISDRAPEKTRRRFTLTGSSQTLELQIRKIIPHPREKD